MLLSKLLAPLSCEMPEKANNTEITSLAYDSRKAVPGSLFVCLVGDKTDGHLYAQSAYGNGCRAFLVSREVALPDDAVIVATSDTRHALAVLSDVFFGHPSGKLRLIGITGTKGKTTTATLLAEALNRKGYKTGLIGTTGIRIGDKVTPVANTTPESYELHRAFAEMVDFGAEYAVLEVSSQAYLRGRVAGLSFHLGIFTNLSPDHIGGNEHPDFENYRMCKSMLFAHSRTSLINADDAYGQSMALAAMGDVFYYGIDAEADYAAEEIADITLASCPGVSFSVTPPNRAKQTLFVRTPGKFSVYNALSVLAACDLLGVGTDGLSEIFETTAVSGRFETVNTSLSDRTFIIDYAHNELSLRSLLETVKATHPKRLVVLFGSVGGRTGIRREALGRAASEFADLCILTSDNPDFEDPSEILSDIEKGITNGCRVIKIPDRREAIGYAVSHSEPGDVILFAGKGHEQYQLIRGVKEPFCEKELIEEAAKLASWNSR